MISNHQVITCAIGVDYVAPESMQALGRAFVEVILDIDIEKLPVSDLQTPASEYLMRCGMTKEQVERLKDRLTK